VSEYSGTRADGWRDADPEAIERSIQELLAGGRKGAAARIARDAGQTERALEWFQELGLHYQAGACLRELGRLEAAQQELLAVEVGSSNYRKACFELITVSEQLGRLDFDADRLLTQFVDEGPNDADEIESFLDLSRLYSLAGFASSARRCALKVVGLDPTHEEALELAGAAREKAATRSVRPKPRVQSSGEGLPPLPTVDELIALAKQHAP
jgi:tetratricopeptide (TPR) repeat protein